MGWFGKGILDGDAPRDYETDIEVLCGYDMDIHEDEDPSQFVTKEKLEEIQLSLYDQWKEEDADIYAFQVLAALMVSKGAKFEPLIMEMCVKCLEMDDWAKKNYERKYHVNYLLNILNNYDNTPTCHYDKNIPVEDSGWAVKMDTANYVAEIVGAELKTLSPLVVKVKLSVVKKSNYGITVLLDDSKKEATKEVFKKIEASYFGLPVVILTTSDFQ